VPNPAFGDLAGAYQEYWAAQSEALAAKSSNGQFVFAETSTHQLHRDAGDLVIDEQDELVLRYRLLIGDRLPPDEAIEAEFEQFVS